MKKEFFLNISDRLLKLRKEAGYTQSFVAKELGVAPQNYQGWEKGRRIPKKDSLEKLARVFNVSVGYLLGETDNKEEYELLETMKQLPSETQEQLLEAAEKVAENHGLTILVKGNERQLHEYKVLNQALAAGTGFGYTDEIEYDIVYWKNDINYDQAVWIKGDSMEPTYPNWDVALIIEQSCFDYEGQVCAVDDVENGKSYIKCVYTGEDGLILKSINTSLNEQGELKYPDIYLPFDSSPKVIGKVIGHFTPEQV